MRLGLDKINLVVSLLLHSATFYKRETDICAPHLLLCQVLCHLGILPERLLLCEAP